MPNQFNRKYNFRDSIFKTCNSGTKAYWLGFIMADGNVCDKDGICCRFNLTSKDIDHLEKFNRFVRYSKPIEKKVGDRRDGSTWTTYRIVIDSKLFATHLSRYGIIPRKTGKEQIKNIPEAYVNHFIRGFFDGDGCVSESRTYQSFSISSSNKGFLEEIQQILMEKCDVNLTKLSKQTPLRKDGSRSNSWGLRYGGRRQIKRIFDYLYNGSNVHLARKCSKFKEVFSL